MTQPSKKKRIAILGGGPAGLSTAYHLTKKRGWENEYEITVYQMGWRLGGKAASSRASKTYGRRIEEHGIHLFGNFYLNMFQMLKDCYDTLYKDENGNPIPTDEPVTEIDKAFLGSNFQGLPDFVDGKWVFNTGWLAHNDGKPWNGELPDPAVIAKDIGYQVYATLTGKKPPFEPHVKPGGEGSRIFRWIEDRLLGWLARTLWKHLRKASHDHSKTLGVLVRIRRWIQRWMHWRANHSVTFRWKFIQVDLMTTLLQGIIADDVFDHDIDALDKWDYREWLQRHDIDPMTLASGFAQIVPNIGFNYPDGDSTGFPAFSAAPYVYFFLRQIYAEGDALYFFAAGTGDSVVAPVYRTLLKRGVKFEFFHRVTDVVPGSDDTIDEVRFDVQATTRNSSAYEPMIRVKGMYSWPPHPKYEDLNEGDALRDEHIDLESYWTPWKGKERVLKCGADGPDGFDYAVLAISVAAHRDICSKIIDQKPDWQEMVDHIDAFPTQHLQVWLDKTVEELGWRFPSIEGTTNRVVGANYTYPFNTFCDFTDLIEWEDWPAEYTPKSVIYWSGPLQKPKEWPHFSDHGFPAEQNIRVRATSIQYLRTIRGLLPDANDNPDQPQSLNFDWLHTPEPAKAGRGEDSIDQQFWKVNIDPTERYVASIKNTVQYRKKAWESGYRNLALAGDWTYNGMNIGSIECATTSGALASLALSGYPKVKDIPGADFLHKNFHDPDKPLMDEGG